MKTIQKIVLVIRIFALMFLALLTGLQCKKDITEIEKLPPATQTGADTFGCLVDGKALTPKSKGWFDTSPLSCYYQAILKNGALVNYFVLHASDKTTYPNAIHAIFIRADSLEFDGEPKTYPLKNYNTPGELCGEFVIFSNGTINSYQTNNQFQGELNITRFDSYNAIISGTFWFDAINDKGKVVKVREGRFDVHFIW